MNVRHLFLTFLTLTCGTQTPTTRSMNVITPQNIIAASTIIGAATAGALWYKYYYAVPTYVAVIVYDDSITEVRRTLHFIDQLMCVRDTPWITGAIVIMESGGGAPGQSADIYDMMRNLVAVKPVIVHVLDACASGAYLGCCPATIVATAMSSIGCIGVNGIYTKLFPEKFDNDDTQGVLEVHPFSAGKYKAIHNPHTPFTDETKAQVQHEIDAHYEAFLRLVADARNLDINRKDEWAEGKSFTGFEALELGLIDYVGGFTTAQTVMQNQLRERAGKPIENIQLFELL